MPDAVCVFFLPAHKIDRQDQINIGSFIVTDESRRPGIRQIKINLFIADRPQRIDKKTRIKADHAAENDFMTSADTFGFRYDNTSARTAFDSSFRRTETLSPSDSER